MYIQHANLKWKKKGLGDRGSNLGSILLRLGPPPQIWVGSNSPRIPRQ